MKIGLGLYRGMLDDRHYRFAVQLGATHIVAHLEDYFSARPQLTSGRAEGWGAASDRPLWTEDDFRALMADMAAHGLTLAAVENFCVRHWSDILLDGPRKHEQMDGLKSMVRAAGRAGLPCIGYNFSLAGVWGWSRGPFARGGAMSVGFDGDAIDPDLPMPLGMVWNMGLTDTPGAGTLPPVSAAEIWERYTWFLQELIPVAEEAGVRMAAHPDDPPMPALRGTARLINSPESYLRAFDIAPSPANVAELCLGSIQEMPAGDMDIYELVERCARDNRIGYVHFRNVRGKVPKYHEVFLDEGDIDMARIIRILKDAGYDGVLIPDHTPELDCDAPWHAGKAFAIGYMKALITTA